MNARMIETGMAWVYRRYTDDPEWIALEDAAREARRGLWRDPNPIPPQEWRSRHRP
ncbi:MAG: thermonuclease family protein [Leptospirales bacterium]